MFAFSGFPAASLTVPEIEKRFGLTNCFNPRSNDNESPLLRVTFVACCID